MAGQPEDKRIHDPMMFGLFLNDLLNELCIGRNRSGLDLNGRKGVNLPADKHILYGCGNGRHPILIFPKINGFREYRRHKEERKKKNDKDFSHTNLF